jgi:hypothetical protein
LKSFLSVVLWRAPASGVNPTKQQQEDLELFFGAAVFPVGAPRTEDRPAGWDRLANYARFGAWDFRSSSKASTKALLTEEQLEKLKEKRLLQSAKTRATWRASAAGKESGKNSSRKYEGSDNGKQTRANYKASEKGQETHSRRLDLQRQTYRASKRQRVEEQAERVEQQEQLQQLLQQQQEQLLQLQEQQQQEQLQLQEQLLQQQEQQQQEQLQLQEQLLQQQEQVRQLLQQQERHQQCLLLVLGC